MKKALLFILIITKISFAQEKEFLGDYTKEELEDRNVLNEFEHFNLSKIWTQTKEQAIVGIIGENHQRIRMKIISVKKNAKNKKQYFVKGKSKVKNNICDFNGIITLKRIQRVKNISYGVDDHYKGKIKTQGLLIADYNFEENKNQKGTGVFEGELYSHWCVFNDSENEFSYDSVQEGDGYRNNLFVGGWTSYRSGEVKKCNWGDWRVPVANDDFDIGAGEFSPNDNYLKFGWDNYRKALLGDKKAQEKEKREWWK